MKKYIFAIAAIVLLSSIGFVSLSNGHRLCIAQQLKLNPKDEITIKGERFQVKGILKETRKQG